MHHPQLAATDATRHALAFPARLGIDGDALRKPLSGVGQYVYQLCRELERLLPPTTRLFAYTRLSDARLALPSARWTVRREPVPALRRMPSFLWLKTRGAALCRADDIELFWAGRTLHPGLAAPIRTLVSVHDLNHLVVPDTMQRATRWSHQLWFADDVRRADCVVANSEGTAARLRSELGVEVRAVVKPGLDPRFRELDAEESAHARARLEALGIRAPYLLSVATLEPRKNVAALLDAFLALKAGGELPRHQLVLAGASGWQNRPLERALAAAQGAGVRRPGFVPDDLLAALYALSDLLVIPSLYEGFGMPALEARACGVRVLISELPELREAAGPGGIAVPPTAEGIQRGILRALRGAPPDTCPQQVREAFAWQRGASQLASLIATP